MALQMNVAGIRRNIKNIAHNYTDAQVKVREATSNDPWGPSSTLMSEIADLTYNVVAFSEIMHMIWKRLNDHGRNWRHVYKALVLLEYLIKTGSEKVADQCKENIFAIQTLKDFQYFEENKDQGMNDDERLRNERVRALKAKERFAQTLTAMGSDSEFVSPTSPPLYDTYISGSTRSDTSNYGVKEDTPATGDLEAARPQTVGEEELQLQLALAMSKEEAEQEEAKRKSDDVRLQMAISQSQEDYGSGQEKDTSAMNDLLDINFVSNSSVPPAVSPPGVSSDPWGMPAQMDRLSPQQQHVPTVPARPDPWAVTLPNGSDSPKQNDPWGSHGSSSPSRIISPSMTGSSDPWLPKEHPKIPESDPWAPVHSEPNNPWEPVSSLSACKHDPFYPLPQVPTCSVADDDFSVLSTRDKQTVTSDIYGKENDEIFNLTTVKEEVHNIPPKSKSPAAFLGENSNLVNLDNLISTKQGPVGLRTSPQPSNMDSMNNNSSFCGNPFVSSASPSFSGANPFGLPPQNPFQVQQTPKPTMNQMKMGMSVGSPSPWGPASAGQTNVSPVMHHQNDPYML